MPTDDLKTQVLELAAIAEQCPEPLRIKCFELLLSDYLERRQRPSEAYADEAPSPVIENGNSRGEPTPNSKDGDEITSVDLHVKARRLFERYGVEMKHVNNLFYKESGQFLPLFEDLRTTRMAESQIRIALLQALQNGLSTGEFQFNGEKVREECQIRKCYDGGNFAANFKNNAQLFDGFDKYDKSNATIRLSDDGRKELAQVMKELE